MKSCVLLLFAFVAAAHGGLFIQDGQEYEYQSSITMSAGTMDHAAHTAATNYQMKVRIQTSGKNLNFEISDVKLTQYVGPIDTKGPSPFANNKYTDLGVPPMTFTVGLDDDGKFASLSYSSSYNTFQKNLIKGWASQMQINSGEIKRGSRSFVSSEKTVHGECDITYTVTDEHVYKNVAHMRDCKSRAYRMVDDWRGHRCDLDHQNIERREGTDGLFSQSSTSFDLEKDGAAAYVIKKIYSSGGLVAQMFETEGVSHYAWFNHTAVLVNRKGSGGDISGGDENTDSLEYEFEDKQYRWNANRDLKGREPFYSSGDFIEDDQSVLKEVLKQGIENQKGILHSHGEHDPETIRNTHMKGIQTLYPIIYSLDYNNLRSIADEFLADKSDNGVMKTNIFFELLGSAGSSASALLVRDLLIENKFDNDRDAGRVLSSVPFHIRRPNTQLVEEFEKLLSLDTERFSEMAIPLSFGHLVRMTCERAGKYEDIKECFISFASKYVTRYFDIVKSSASREERLVALSVMANIRYGGVSEKLKPLIYGKLGASNELRTNAIFAAGFELLIRGKAIDYYMPIFADCDLEHEVRLAALSMIMHARPSATDFGRIMTVLKTEKDYEVINFVFSILERYANSINPCDEETGENAKYFLKYLKQFSQYETDYGFGVSKTFERQFHKKKFGYTGTYMYYTIGSHDSLTPLRIGMGVGTNLMHSYDNHVLGVHLRIEGLAKALIRKFKNMDPTVWKTEDLENILKGMNIRQKPDQPVRVSVTIMLKGTIIINRVYDESSASEEGKIGQFIASMASLEDTYTINHQRVIQLGSMMYEQPCDLGIPLVYLNSITTMAHLTATVKRGILRGLFYRDVSYDMHLFSQGTNLMGFINPGRQVRFGIIQDRIYHAHFPRKFVLGLNPSKKELKLSIERPTFEDPWSLLMHSVTVVAAKPKKINGEVQDFKTQCPGCSPLVVVSKGPGAATDRVFVEKENQKSGYYAKGEYFDCELDVDRRTTLGKAIAAFTPYNKNPKSLWTSISMGIRQIQAFFLFFPKAEKCGAHFKYSQSEVNPVKEIEISLRAQVDENGERMFFRGRKWLVRIYVKAKGDPAPRSYRISVSYDFTPGYIQNRFKLMINRAPVAGLGIDPYTVCVAYDSQFPDFHDEFLGVDFNENLETTGKALLQYGEGTECGDGDGEIRLKFQHSTTKEGKDDLRKKWYYKQCMEQKNSPAWRGRAASALPVSEPCYMTAWDATSARKYTWNIEFVKLTNRMKNIINKAQTIIKAGLLPYWDVDPDEMDVDGNVGPFMNLEATFHDSDSLMDLKMETSQGANEFKNYPLQMNWTPRLRNLKFTRTIKRLMDYGIISPCIATMDSVRTNDNMTYSYNLGNCWSLMSGHCSPTPSYAVFMKKIGGNLPVAAKVYVGGHSIEFDPSGGSISVIVDGSPLAVADQVEQTHTEGQTEIFKIFRWGSTYNVYSFLKVWIVYDGNFVEVIPAPSVTGQHCGLCGNYNRNNFDDLVGKNEQPVSAADMADEWKWQC